MSVPQPVRLSARSPPSRGASVPVRAGEGSGDRGWSQAGGPLARTLAPLRVADRSEERIDDPDEPGRAVMNLAAHRHNAGLVEDERARLLLPAEFQLEVLKAEKKQTSWRTFAVTGS